MWGWGIAYFICFVIAIWLIVAHPIFPERGSLGGILEIVGGIIFAPLYDLIRLIMYVVARSK